MCKLIYKLQNKNDEKCFNFFFISIWELRDTLRWVWVAGGAGGAGGTLKLFFNLKFGLNCLYLFPFFLI